MDENKLSNKMAIVPKETYTPQMAMKKWASENRQHLNEYSAKFYHEKIATNEEKLLKHRERSKENMRKTRQKQKEEKLAKGWIPIKRGRPNKIKPMEIPREPKKRGRKPKTPSDTSDTNNANLIIF